MSLYEPTKELVSGMPNHECTPSAQDIAFIVLAHKLRWRTGGVLASMLSFTRTNDLHIRWRCMLIGLRNRCVKGVRVVARVVDMVVVVILRLMRMSVMLLVVRDVSRILKTRLAVDLMVICLVIHVMMKAMWRCFERDWEKAIRTPVVIGVVSIFSFRMMMRRVITMPVCFMWVGSDVRTIIVSIIAKVCYFLRRIAFFVPSGVIRRASVIAMRNCCRRRPGTFWRMVLRPGGCRAAFIGRRMDMTFIVSRSIAIVSRIR